MRAKSPGCAGVLAGLRAKRANRPFPSFPRKSLYRVRFAHAGEDAGAPKKATVTRTLTARLPEVNLVVATRISLCRECRAAMTKDMEKWAKS